MGLQGPGAWSFSFGFKISLLACGVVGPGQTSFFQALWTL